MHCPKGGPDFIMACIDEDENVSSGTFTLEMLQKELSHKSSATLMHHHKETVNGCIMWYFTSP